MIKMLSPLLLACCVYFAIQGCTYRAWYEGIKEQQRQNCYKYISQDEIDKCLDRVNSMTYDQYEKARKEAKKQKE
jgi:hypothetical protein